VHHRIEMLLEVDALAEGVGADQDVLFRSGQLLDAGLALRRRNVAGDGRDLDLFGQGAAQGIGEIVHRGDEAAKDDGMVAVGQGLFDQVHGALQLGIVRPLQALGGARHAQQAFAVFAFVVGQLADIAAGSGIDGGGGLLDDEIEYGAAADCIRLFGGFGVGCRGAVTQCGGRRRRTGGERAQQGQGRPPGDALAEGHLPGLGDGLAGIADHLVEETAVGFRELVDRFGFEQHPLGEAGLLTHKGLDMAALALDKMVRQPATMAFVFRAGQILRQGAELFVQQGQQGAKGILLAAVRCGSDQEEMAGGVPADALDELMALVLTAVALAGKGAGVGLIDDDELGAGAQKIVAAAVGFDEIGRDHDKGIVLKKGFTRPALPLQPARRMGQHQFGGDMKFLIQLALPLFGQLRRAEHGDAFDLAAVEQLAGDEAGLNGLADADIVGDEQAHGIESKGHEQRCELIRPGLDGNFAERAEGTGAGAKADAQGVAEQMAGAVIAKLPRIGEIEAGGADFFQGSENAGDLVLGAAEGPHHKQFLIRTGQDHPFTAARMDQRADSVTHAGLPKIQGYCATIARQSSSRSKRTTVMPRSARAASCSRSRCRRSGKR